VSAGFRIGLRHRLRRAKLRILTQHRRLHALLRDAEAAALQRAPLCDCVALLRDGLRAHFDLEEEVCFTALHGLEPAARPSLVRLAGDHRAFLDELGQLLGDPPDAAPRLLLLGQALREHEQREEELFGGPLAESAAGTA
jgi:hypothetical protein